MLKGTFENALLSSCCWATLSYESQEARADDTVLWNGTWTCAKCTKGFPQREGVSLLSVLDEDWISALRELIARRRRTRRFLDNQRTSDQREQEQEKQDATAENIMTKRYNQALEQMNITPGAKVLDVGAGMAATSAEFARRGAVVVAAETELSNLLYQSFDLTDSGEIESLIHNGQTLWAKSPSRYPDYFSRVAAPAHRLPFATGTFDVVFCRSVLHHLHDLPRALMEMLRVLKPGGMFVACSEPTRSMLDREENYLVDTCDKIEGMNEQVPRLADYLRPIWSHSRDVITQAWCYKPQYETKRILDRIPYDFRKHLWPGEKVKGWKLAKLLFFSAAVNIYAKRSVSQIEFPPPTRDVLTDFSAETLGAIHTPATLEESLRLFDDGTSQIGNGLRRIVAARQLPSSTFLPGLTHERELRSGWRRRVRRYGTEFRYTHEGAICTVAIPPGSNEIELCIITPNSLEGQISAAPLDVLINEQSAGTIDSVLPGRFNVYRIPLPDRASGPVIDVEIINHRLVQSADEGAPAQLGVGVKYIRAVADKALASV